MSKNKSVAASGHPEVTRAAISTLDVGGNAFDAAVAAGFAGAVAEPALTSLGGGGFLLAHNAESGEDTLFDFFVDTPGKGSISICEEPHFFPVTVKFSGAEQVFNIGRGSVACPGCLKGYLHIHKKLGSLPLSEVIKPAVTLARKGVKINSHQGHFLRLLFPIMTHSKEGRKIFQPYGSYIENGQIFKNPDIAYFMEGLSNGKMDLYSGETAKLIVRDMRSGFGLITEKDLKGYHVIEREPLKTHYRGMEILTNPPPAFGGPLLGLALSILNKISFSDIEWGEFKHLEAISMLQMAVEKSREAHINHEGIDEDRELENKITEIRKRFSRGTTHISIIDFHGNAASMTTSNGEGSGYIVPGTGIMLNNMLGEDDLHPHGFHASPPGMRVSSMMSPVLVKDNKNRIKLVLGSGGSKRIRSAILQTMVNHLDFKIKLQEAVNLPRMHWDQEKLHIEPGYPQTAIKTLGKYIPVKQWEVLDMFFGGVQAVNCEGSGAGDIRRGGNWSSTA